MLKMTQENTINIKKIGYISCILLLLFYTASILFAWLQKIEEEELSYELNAWFQNVESSGLWEVSVALTSNIGTRLKERQALPADVYKWTIDIGDSIGTSESTNKELIRKNMFFVQAYLNLLKTDVLNLLDSSKSRKDSLDTFISQLELKYKDANLNLIELSSQLQSMQAIMTASEQRIWELKVKIDRDFKAFDAISTNENVQEYFGLRAEYTYARTHIIYINQFVRQYNFLNNYNKALLDTLINNKAALASGSFVVVPDSGSDLLRKLNLIYDEQEFKALWNVQEEVEQ